MGIQFILILWHWCFYSQLFKSTISVYQVLWVEGELVSVPLYCSTGHAKWGHCLGALQMSMNLSMGTKSGARIDFFRERKKIIFFCHPVRFTALAHYDFWPRVPMSDMRHILDQEFIRIHLRCTGRCNLRLKRETNFLEEVLNNGWRTSKFGRKWGAYEPTFDESLFTSFSCMIYPSGPSGPFFDNQALLRCHCRR